MTDRPRILAFAGSTRRDSFNHRLVAEAARQAEEAGAEVTLIRLSELDLPLFDEDLEREQGTPAGATRFKELLVAADGLLIASPEYNSSVTAALKNAIDWASRPAEGEAPLVAFRGKVAGLVAASPGALGGLRGLVHIRSILGNIGVIVLPDQAAIGAAHEAFDAEGRLSREADGKRVKAVADAVVRVAGQVAAR